MMIPKVGYYAMHIHGPGATEVSFEVIEVEVSSVDVRETERDDGQHPRGPYGVRPDLIAFPDSVSPKGIEAAKEASLACALRYYIDEEKRLADEILRAGARIRSCREAISSYPFGEKDKGRGASE